jgi:hypothetical protein
MKQPSGKLILQQWWQGGDAGYGKWRNVPVVDEQDSQLVGAEDAKDLEDDDPGETRQMVMADVDKLPDVVCLGTLATNDLFRFPDSRWTNCYYKVLGPGNVPGHVAVLQVLNDGERMMEISGHREVIRIVERVVRLDEVPGMCGFRLMHNDDQYVVLCHLADGFTNVRNLETGSPINMASETKVRLMPLDEQGGPPDPTINVPQMLADELAKPENADIVAKLEAAQAEVKRQGDLRSKRLLERDEVQERLSVLQENHKHLKEHVAGAKALVVQLLDDWSLDGPGVSTALEQVRDFLEGSALVGSSPVDVARALERAEWLKTDINYKPPEQVGGAGMRDRILDCVDEIIEALGG